MKQRQQMFLSVNRIGLLLYAPLCIALAVYYLFTGAPVYAAFSACTPVFLLVPQALRRIFAFRDSQLLRLYYHSFLLLAYSGCLVLRLGRRLPGFQLVTYAFGGFFLCITAAAFLFCLLQRRPQAGDLRFASLFGVSFALAAGAIWELLHIAVDELLLGRALTAQEIAFDLLACLVGALVPPLLAILQERLGFHMYPLYALEDCIALNARKARTTAQADDEPSAQDADSL